MKRMLVILLVVGLVLGCGKALAFWRPIAKSYRGDPDEFQCHRLHDKNDVLMNQRRPVHPWQSEMPPQGNSGHGQVLQKKRRLVTHFSGIDLFLEP